MIQKTCHKCRQKYKYGKKCSCVNKHNKKMSAIKGTDDDFYTSTRWRKLRAMKLEEYNCTCQRCLVNERKIVSENPQGHHLKPRSKYPELELEPDNIVILCKNCNLELGDSDIVDWDRSKEIKQDMKPCL